MDETKVHMTGFPRLDAYASLDIRKESMEVRQLLGLDDRPIVLFAGQATPTGAMLDELVEVLNNIGGEDLYLFPRPHPRTRANYPSEMRPWQRALARFRGLLIVDWFRVCTLPQLVAAAAHCGAVVSMYSTVLLEAAAARGSAIAMLYPEALQAFRTENPGLEQFPLVELGCVAHAYDRSSLEDRLRAELWGQNSCRQRQELHICVDGQNACRAAEVIRTLI
jgi:hypothetical protein